MLNLIRDYDFDKKVLERDYLKELNYYDMNFIATIEGYNYDNTRVSNWGI